MPRPSELLQRMVKEVAAGGRQDALRELGRWLDNINGQIDVPSQRLGGGGASASDAAYLVAAATTALLFERILTVAAPLTATDGGSHGNFELGFDDADFALLSAANVFLQLQTMPEAHIGDEATNYAEFGADGTLTLAGTARVVNERQISVVSTRNGASAPTEANRAVGASGGVLLPVKQFSNVIQQDIYFEIHPGDGIDNSANVNLHIMWLPGSGWTSGNYVWKLEYLIKNENGAAHNTGAPTTISANVTPANATDTLETIFADSIDLNWDETAWCHFYRDVANDNADDTGDLRYVEVSYTANKLGQ